MYVRTYFHTYVHMYSIVYYILILIQCSHMYVHAYVRMYIRTNTQCVHKFSIIPVFTHPAQKLTHIEMEFSSRHSNDVASVDERLAFYQNQCDQRAKQQVKLEVRTIIIHTYLCMCVYVHLYSEVRTYVHSIPYHHYT